MRPPRDALFLERETYRRRRIMDAARILPVAGFVLVLLPVLWSRDDGSNVAAEAVYLFVLWSALILAAALVARPLRGGFKREHLSGSAPVSSSAPVASLAPVASSAPATAPPEAIAQATGHERGAEGNDAEAQGQSGERGSERGSERGGEPGRRTKAGAPPPEPPR